MSTALATSSRLKPEIRLAQAVSEFEATLSGEQKATFRTYRSQTRDSPPDTHDVMRLTAEIDRSASRKARRCFGPRFTNMLHAVQQFASLGDILIGGSQNLIACGVWSLVRMSLLMVSQSISYLEKISVLFMAVGRSAPRYQAMAILYPRSKKLQTYLCEYFIIVVQLCHKTAKFAQKSVLSQISSTLTDSDIKRFQAELELWASSIKEEVTLITSQKIEEEAQESSIFRTLILKSSSTASYQKNLEARIRWLNACSTFDYETSWKQARKRGNTTWFIQQVEYQDWTSGRAFDSPFSRASLFMTGKLGSGKTILMANIVDDLTLTKAKGTVAYFFCRYDISESLSARTIIGCLARQLLQQSPNIDKLDEALGAADCIPNSDSALQILKAAFPDTLNRHYWPYLVLDGLDECETEERHILAEFLEQFRKISDLRICISSRSDVNIQHAPRLQADSWRTITIPDNNPDIEGFIEAELEARIESGKLSVGNPVIILEIQDALQAGAQGMFLWVALQIDSICMEKTDEDIRTALKNIPLNLFGTFDRILQKAGRTGARHQRKILKLVAAALRPLTTDELREALGVTTLGCCGSLITIDEEELTVRFAHHSIKQFLVEQVGYRVNKLGRIQTLFVPSRYSFELEDAGRLMGDTIVTYLNYGVFDTQLSRVVVPKIQAKEAPSKIMNSVLGQSKGRNSVKYLAIGLLRSRKQSSFDIGKVLSDARDSVQPSSAGDFQFLSYAKAYWLHHTMSFGIMNSLGESKTISPLWKKVVRKHITQAPTEISTAFYEKLDKGIWAKDESTGIKAYMAKARLKRGIRVVMLANRIESLKMEEDDDSANKEDLMSERDTGRSAIFQVVVFAKLRDARESENEMEFERKARETGNHLWMIDIMEELRELLGIRKGSSYSSMYTMMG